MRVGSIIMQHNGMEHPIRKWADVLGVPYATVRMRYVRGKRTFEELFMNYRGQSVVRFDSEHSRVVHQHRTMLDDMFPADTVRGLRILAERVGSTPLAVATKIVTKRVQELVDQPLKP